MTAIVSSRRPSRRMSGDAGSFAALELMICSAFVIVMILLIAGLGRVSRGRQLVDQAALAAARAGSLSGSPVAATSAAQHAAEQTLSDRGLSCAGLTVSLDTTHFYAGGQVSATVTCTTDLSGLAMAGLPGSVHLQASSTAPLETYRTIGQGTGP